MIVFHIDLKHKRLLDILFYLHSFPPFTQQKMAGNSLPTI